jgi:outer membrane protein assembly factor BamB
MRTCYIIILSTLLIFLLTTQGKSDDPEILWWYDLDAPSFGSAAVGDIDGDSLMEIVFGTYFNDEKIHAINAESGDTLWTYNTGGCNDASPVIADVDLDGEMEVIVPASSPCMVYCFDGATGEVEWSTPTSPNSIDSPPAIADVDNDSLPEIIFGTFYGYVYVLNGEDGSLNWRFNLGSNSYIQSSPNILDIGNDGQLDIVVAQWAGDNRIYALKGDDHEILWYNDDPTDWMYHSGSFGDIDEDGLPEIVIGCYDNHVYMINAEDGSLNWDYESSFYFGAPTSMADLNNDDHLEIVSISYNKVIVLSHTGDSLWSYSTGGNMFRGAAISDINGDDSLDIAFGSDDGILRVLRGSNGAVIWTYDLEAHYGNDFEMDHAPVIADFDNDGDLDIFIIGGHGSSTNPENNHGRAYALTAGIGAGPGWPMFRKDVRHSACIETHIDYICGDTNRDDLVNVSDAVYIVNYIFVVGSPAPYPIESGDVNCDGIVNVSDAVWIINYVFVGGNESCDTNGDDVLDC